MWDPGNRSGHRTAAPPGPTRTHARGFTLIELMVVVAIVAMAAGAIALTLRDPAATRLDREAARLVALLESARAEARASALTVYWVPARPGDPGLGPKGERLDFRFVGLPPASRQPTTWLDPETRAQVVGGPTILLGPEAVIGMQRIVLGLDGQRIEIATDGLGPFEVAAAADAPS
jgi:general secretion pathway protein H